MIRTKKEIEALLRWEWLQEGFLNNSSSYIPQAQLLFDAVPSIPNAVKPIYNDIIQTFVETGVWAESGFRAVMCVPSENHDEYFIEIKTLVKVPEYYTAASTPMTAPYDTNNARASSKGFIFKGTSYFIDTGWISNDLQTDASHGNILVTFNTVPVLGQYASGGFDGTNSNLIGLNFTSSRSHMDTMNLSPAQGRLQKNSATGEAGVYFMNRRAVNDAEMYINGVIGDSMATTGGTLLTIPDFLGTYNNSGSPTTKYTQTPFAAYIKLGAGVSAPNAATLNTALMTWQNSMQMIEGSFDKQIIFDGNSHLVMQWSKQVRGTEYGQVVKGYDTQNFGVSGQTTQQMTADAVAQIDTLYNAGYSKNILIAFEMTNDMQFNGVAVTYSDYVAYCQARQAAGWTVVATQMMTRTSAGNTDGVSQEQYDLNTDSINVQVRDNWATFADAFVEAPPETFVYRADYASDALYAAAMLALRTDLTYFYTDMLHLSDVGYGLWSDKYNTLIPTL